MFEFLSAKYRNPTELVRFQDYLMGLSGMDLSKVDSYIDELNKYSILFKPFMGLNAIPENNIAIRQNLILATLYYIKDNKPKARELKEKADNIFVNLKTGWMYQEGYSYFLYVKQAYDFYLKHVHQYFAGNIDTMSLITMMETYRKIANYDGSLPVNETYFEHRTNPEQERINFSNNLCSTYFLNNQSTYILVNHGQHLNTNSKNLHINYDWGHFSVYHKGRWQILHPWYPGYAAKSASPIKESWNHNIIVDGIRTNEPSWRYLPNKPHLIHTKNGNTHNFKIGRNREHGSRRIEIMNNGIVVSDSGGEYSSFNLSDDCEYDVIGKVEKTVGYHSISVGKVVEHKRIKLYGANRVFSMAF